MEERSMPTDETLLTYNVIIIYDDDVHGRFLDYDMISL